MTCSKLAALVRDYFDALHEAQRYRGPWDLQLRGAARLAKRRRLESNLEAVTRRLENACQGETRGVMSKTTRKNMEERQALVSDLRKQINAMDEAIEQAESCETPEDFDVNVTEAIASARMFIAEAHTMRDVTLKEGTSKEALESLLREALPYVDMPAHCIAGIPNPLAVRIEAALAGKRGK